MDERIVNDATSPKQVQFEKKIEDKVGNDEARLGMAKRASHESDPGALDDLINDYDYTSQPNTPGFVAPAEFSPETRHEETKPEVASPMFTSTVTNIRRIDANPTATSSSGDPEPRLSTTTPPKDPSPTNDSSTIDDPSFVANLMKSFDSGPPHSKPQLGNATTTSQPPDPPQQ